jgi:hypothetical protein
LFSSDAENVVLFASGNINLSKLYIVYSSTNITTANFPVGDVSPFCGGFPNPSFIASKVVFEAVMFALALSYVA